MGNAPDFSSEEADLSLFPTLAKGLLMVLVVLIGILGFLFIWAFYYWATGLDWRVSSDLDLVWGSVFLKGVAILSCILSFWF